MPAAADQTETSLPPIGKQGDAARKGSALESAAADKSTEKRGSRSGSAAPGPKRSKSKQAKRPQAKPDVLGGGPRKAPPVPVLTKKERKKLEEKQHYLEKEWNLNLHLPWTEGDPVASKKKKQKNADKNKTGRSASPDPRGAQKMARSYDQYDQYRSQSVPPGMYSQQDYGYGPGYSPLGYSSDFNLNQTAPPWGGLAPLKSAPPGYYNQQPPLKAQPMLKSGPPLRSQYSLDESTPMAVVQQPQEPEQPEPAPEPFQEPEREPPTEAAPELPEVSDVVEPDTQVLKSASRKGTPEAAPDVRYTEEDIQRLLEQERAALAARFAEDQAQKRAQQVSEEELQQKMREDRNKVLQTVKYKEERLQMEYEHELQKERERLLERERELEWEREKARIREIERQMELERQRLLDVDLEEAKEKARLAERERERAERWAMDQQRERERELEKEREWEREREREREYARERERQAERLETIKSEERRSLEDAEMVARMEISEMQSDALSLAGCLEGIQRSEISERHFLLTTEAQERNQACLLLDNVQSLALVKSELERAEEERRKYVMLMWSSEQLSLWSLSRIVIDEDKVRQGLGEEEGAGIADVSKMMSTQHAGLLALLAERDEALRKVEADRLHREEIELQMRLELRMTLKLNDVQVAETEARKTLEAECMQSLLDTNLVEKEELRALTGAALKKDAESKQSLEELMATLQAVKKQQEEMALKQQEMSKLVQQKPPTQTVVMTGPSQPTPFDGIEILHQAASRESSPTKAASMDPTPKRRDPRSTISTPSQTNLLARADSPSQTEFQPAGALVGAPADDDEPMSQSPSQSQASPSSGKVNHLLRKMKQSVPPDEETPKNANRPSMSPAKGLNMDITKYNAANNDPRLASAEPEAEIPDPFFKFDRYQHITNSQAMQVKLFLSAHSHISAAPIHE